MEQIIYGDTLFLINFSMDFLSLYICGKILNSDPSFASLVMSAGVGAVYAVAILFMEGSSIAGGLINSAVALLMCFIAYGIPSFLLLVRNTLMFYGISFLMGGCMTAIFNTVNKGLEGRGIVINGDLNTLHSTLPWEAVAIAAAVSVVLSYICSMILKKTKETKRVQVHVRWQERETEFTAVVDSGNFLCEPNGSLPVIICGYDTIDPLLPIGLKSMFRENRLGIMEFVPPDIAKSIRMIPVTTVNANTLALGIIPDECRINGEKKRLCIATTGKGTLENQEAVLPATLL